MAEQPRVTVCIPTYDRTRWLARAIDSVLAQTFTAFRLEIHDDATPGRGVHDVVTGYDDPRVVLIEHEQNAGIVGNFTRSLLGADTDYVIQLGDDDIAAPELVARTVAALDAFPRAGVAHSRFALIDGDGTVTMAAQDWLGTPSPPLEPGRDFVSRSMVHGCRVCSSTALIRRSAAPEGGFLERDAPPFDFAFWLRMAREWDVAFVDEVLCQYRIHGQSFTSGLSDVTRTGYLQAEKTLREVHAVKRRYAPEFARVADRALRQDIISRVRERTLPDRPFLATFRGLGDAARREPGILREPHAWKLLAGSLVGPGLVRRLQRGA